MIDFHQIRSVTGHHVVTVALTKAIVTDCRQANQKDSRVVTQISAIDPLS
jgi:hypothetical protein